jgi:hypothetical protein
LDGLIYACLKKHDFWSNTSIELPDPSDTLTFVKEIFRKQVVHFRNNEILKRLQRWELSNENAFVSELKKQREENGLERIEMISRITKIPYADLAAIGSIITAGICYLAMLEETCQYYNGINIKSDEGWEQLIRGIDNILNLKYNENGN